MSAITRIRDATTEDAGAIAQIYNHYITNTVVTFEVTEISAAEMADRMQRIQSDSFPFLAAEREGEIVGYAYAGKWHARHAYRYSAETSVYLAPDCIRQGVGTVLYGDLIKILIDKGIHTAIGGIALPNEGSVKLHEKFGFEKAAHYREVGYKFDCWIDVGYWQRFLSVNSPAAGLS